MLGEELGIEPGPALRALEEQILLQDPSLDDPTTAPPPQNLQATPTSFIGRGDTLIEPFEGVPAALHETLTSISRA